MSKSYMIPHVKPLYGKAERKAIARYLNGNNYLTEYIYTQQLEDELAKFLKVPYISVVTSGTTALYVALKAVGIGYGDEVIVPDLTMIATPNAVVMAGATPILFDVNHFGCLDIDKLKVTVRTKALIYVELNGRGDDVIKARNFCKKNNLVFIEDAAQALGSEHDGQYLGTFGRFGCFSLGFHKIITTGQGGFIVSHNKKDYETIERIKDFGRIKGGNDIHNEMGFNFKITDLQAVLGLTQLKTLPWRINKKRQIYEWYHGREADKGYTPWFIEWSGPNRDKLARQLKKAGIDTRPMYPPLHTQKIYPGGVYPEATKRSKETLWLPSSVGLNKKEVEYINAYL